MEPEIMVNAKRLAMAQRRSRRDPLVAVMSQPSKEVQAAQARLRETILRQRAGRVK